MLVTKENFDVYFNQLLTEARAEKILALDTETTGIWWWRSPHVPWYKPEVFSVQISSAKTDYYFDFRDSLTKRHWQELRELTEDPEILWFIQNAKFDMHHLMNHGVEIFGTIHDTKTIARILNNCEQNLSLDDLGEKYLGSKKYDVKTYMNENGLYTQVKKFGHNDKYENWYHFDKLPIEMLVDYGQKDTRLCYDLGMFQRCGIVELQSKSTHIFDVRDNEYALTKVFFEMEREGIKIDHTYTEQAYEHEIAEYQRIEKDLNAIVGKSIDWLSPKQLKSIFDALGEPYGYTEKGNASFDHAALEDSESKLAKLILKYRYHNKRAHTYFENYLWFADENGVVHCDFQQNGTQFGRVSCWAPNLLNIPKRSDKEESTFKVRRCFVPKWGILGDADYKGAEYFMAMDYAREMPIVEELKSGLDPHTRLSKEMGLKDRDSAKTMQFRILYGGGKAAVGRALGYKGAEAERIGGQKKKEYFEHAPALASFIRKVSAVAQSRGYIFNWLGRILYYGRDTAYKATNGLIQSGVGDTTKVAMVKISEILKGKKTKMLLQIYDAILFEIHPDELNLIPVIKKTMAEVYPYKVLPMQVDMGFSRTSWDTLTDTLHA